MTSPKLRILLVEDHIGTADAVRRFLEVHGYWVHVAPDVRRARAFAKESSFNLLLCDIQLPDGTGWQLLRSLRNNGDFSAIAISGFGSDSDLARSKAAGFSLHLVKPLSPDELIAAIEVVAAQPRQDRPARRRAKKAQAH